MPYTEKAGVGMQIQKQEEKPVARTPVRCRGCVYLSMGSGVAFCMFPVCMRNKLEDRRRVCQR